MELVIKKQLEKEPNKWIQKALTVLFVVLVILWASKGINFSGIKENGVDIADVEVEDYVLFDVMLEAGDYK